VIIGLFVVAETGYRASIFVGGRSTLIAPSWIRTHYRMLDRRRAILSAISACSGLSFAGRFVVSAAQGMKQLEVGLAGLGDFNTLDPARAATSAPVIVLWQIFDRLVAIDATGETQPGLASSWQSSPELNEWAFQIRTDARFHTSDGSGGSPVTPADVRSSILRAMRVPGYAQTLLEYLVVGAQDFIAGKSSDIPGLQAASDNVSFKLTRPFAFLPERLAAS